MSSSKYSDEWFRLFEPSPRLPELRQCCFDGELAGSKFRSVCWRILLGCLPLEKANWLDVLSQSRAVYTNLKQRVMLNPSELSAQHDPSLVNPLSLHDNNPWQQYFSDQELTQLIQQDVRRTFPELEYFQSDQTRDLMQNVLFVYARHKPHIAYKQGMHEILGPLLFVLFSDYQAYAHTFESGTVQGIPPSSQHLVNELCSDKYLEHDSFTLFTQIMSIIEPWYCAPETASPTKSPQSTPFVRPQDANSSSAVVHKLNEIGDQLLRSCDVQLYTHLETMQIAPQIYGIRWLRLLFGREFPIQDLLLVWDSIFADGPPFVLVDYIFIAMLVTIRHLLLGSDYTGCLNYLMRFPPIVDVHSFLKLSVNLRNTKGQSAVRMSSSCGTNRNFAHITQSGAPHPNRMRDDVLPASAQTQTQAHNTPSHTANLLNQMASNFKDNLKEVANAAKSDLNKHDHRRLASNKASKQQPNSRPTSVHRTHTEQEPFTANEPQACASRVMYLESMVLKCADQLEACVDVCGGGSADVRAVIHSLRSLLVLDRPASTSATSSTVGSATPKTRAERGKEALNMSSTHALSPDVSHLISALPQDNELAALSVPHPLEQAP